MTKGVRLALWLIVIGLLAGIYVVATDSLKQRLETRLSAAFGRPATVRKVHLTLPPGMLALGIEVPAGTPESQGLSIRRLTVSINLASALRGRSLIDLELDGPRFGVERDPQGAIAFGLPKEVTPEGVLRVTGVPVSRLRIRNGELSLRDRAVSPEVAASLRELSLSLLPSPHRNGYSYSMSAALEDVASGQLGSLQADGEWVSVAGECRIVAQHNAVGSLKPYLERIIGVAPVEGAFRVDSLVTLLEGKMVAHSHLTATGLEFPDDEPTVLGPSGKRLVQLLTDPDGAIHLEFVVSGKLGEPLDWSNLVEATLRESMRQALTHNIQRALTEAERGNMLEDTFRRSLDSIEK